MTDADFYGEFVPGVLRRFLESAESEEAEQHLPDYGPFLGGSRYSLRSEKGHFGGLDLETTREEMLLSVVRGSARYSGSHLKALAGVVPLGDRVMLSGSGAGSREFALARRRWFGDFEFVYQEQSALLGAAMLGRFHATGSYPGLPASTAASSARSLH
jgi:sugar (pentulose or hexulose) kinase